MSKLKRKVFYILFNDGTERIFPLAEYDYCVSSIKIWIYPKHERKYYIINRASVKFYTECVSANKLWKLRKRLMVRWRGV